MNKPDQHDPSVRVIQAAKPIPVFGCQIMVTPGDASTPWKGRVANYVGFEASGDSERAVLQQIVKQFKSVAAAKLEAGEELEMIEPPLAAGPQEQIRFVAVHL